MVKKIALEEHFLSPGFEDYWQTTTGDIDPAVLEQHCRASLAGYKIPRRWLQAESLPRNAYGKVVKRDLRAGLETAS